MKFKQFFSEAKKFKTENMPKYGNVTVDRGYSIERTHGVYSFTLHCPIMLGGKTLQLFDLGKKVMNVFLQEHQNLSKEDIKYLSVHGAVEMRVKVKKNPMTNKWELIESSLKIRERDDDGKDINVIYGKGNWVDYPSRALLINSDQYKLICSVAIRDMKRHIQETFNKHINTYCLWVEGFYREKTEEDNADQIPGIFA